MTANGNEDPTRTTLSATTIDLAIRLGFIGLLGYWSFRVIAPFLTIGMWSAILAVALYPMFYWLAQRLNPRLAAVLVTLSCLMIVIGPVTWLGLGMVAGVGALAASLDTPPPANPLPPESGRHGPPAGARLHELWSLAATNLTVALAEVAPMLRPVGTMLLGLAQSALFALLELLAAIVIAGFLFTRGPQLADAMGAILGRALSHRGK